jgi:hypothetical protein
MTLRECDQHSLGSLSEYRTAGAASHSLTAKDFLIDRMQFLVSFVRPFTNPNANTRTEAEGKRDLDALKTLAGQMFKVCRRSTLTKPNKHKDHDRLVNIGAAVTRSWGGQQELLVHVTLSPIRYSREKLYPGHPSSDFLGNDNFLPETPRSIVQTQRDQMSWMKREYTEVCERVKRLVPDLRLDWVKCQHIEIVYDIETSDASATAKAIRERIQAFTKDPYDSVDGSTCRSGKVKDAKLGGYQKSNTKSRVQLTLEVNRSKELKDSGRFLRDGFKVDRLLEAIIDKHGESINAVLTLEDGQHAADCNTQLEALIQTLRRFVSAAAAQDIALQIVRTGQIRFGSRSSLGDARKKLKDVGAMYSVGRGVYKLVSLARLHSLAEAKDASAVTKPEKLTALSVCSVPTLESLTSRNDQLTWEERLGAFAWLLLPGVRVISEATDDAVDSGQLPNLAMPRLETQPVKRITNIGQGLPLTP